MTIDGSCSVYQGLIRSCSHQFALDAAEQPLTEQPEEFQEQLSNKVTYRDYLDLWKVLLEPNKVKVNGY